MLKLTYAAACRVPRVRARLASLLILAIFALASGVVAGKAKAAVEDPTSTDKAARNSAGQIAWTELQSLDLIDLRREVATWQAAYSGPIAGKVVGHAARVQQIIDQLTVLQRATEKAAAATSHPQVTHQLARLHAAWPAWLMADFEPPPSLRTIVVRNANELKTAVDDAQPGDEIILADGDWREFSLAGAHQLQGTAARPIVLRAQTPGETTLVAGQAMLTSANVIFRNFSFQGNAVEGGDGQHVFEPCFTFSGRNIRLSNCLFVASEPSAGITIQGQGVRFDRNFVSGQFAGSAVRMAGTGCQCDGNYFGWRMPAGSNAGNSATLEILASATNTVVQSNFLSGPGANVRDAGHSTLVHDNTFQNMVQPALTLAPRSHDAIIRGNLAFDTGGFELRSSDARLSNNYLEYGRVFGTALARADHNTLLLPPENPVAQGDFDPGLLRGGSSNMISTETQLLWPREPQFDQTVEAFDSEEDSRPVTLIRDVLGYLRPHRRFGDLGFRGDIIPLGRGSEVGPTWLPTELAINRPLRFDYQQQVEPSADSPNDLYEQSIQQTLLSVEEAAHQASSLLQPRADSWTLQGWVHNPASLNQDSVLAEASAGEDHWQLSWTADRRLVLSGETGGAEWSLATEPDYESEAGRSYFAVIVEQQSHGWEVGFYRGNEAEAVDLIAAEVAPALAFLQPTGFRFVRGTGAQQGLISARLFCTPEMSAAHGAPQFGVLNASDLESLRQGDLARQ